MLIQNITEDELKAMECFSDSICMAETLFSNVDNMSEFDQEKLGEIRLYQKPMISHESIIDFDTTAKHHKLDKKQKFQLRKNTGDLYNLGGRKTGKSLCTLKIDICLSSIYDRSLKGCFYSIDEKRLRGITNDVKRAFDYHPVFKLWKYENTFKPEISFTNINTNWHLQCVNMALKGKAPGDQFYQIHAEKFWGDEVSFETEEVHKKRKEAESELGAIIRLAGMTNFTKHSPIGKIFFNIRNKKFILNLCQFVNPYWDAKEKLDRIETYGGEGSLSYRIFCKGEVVEDADTEFDMDRVRNCFIEKKEIKRFELKKIQYKNFKDLIVVERPKNSQRIFIVGDIGDGAGGSDISIFSEIDNDYYYLYNIALYNMTEDEQDNIFNFLVEQLQANILAFDCGEACGRGLYDRFEKRGYKDNLVWYHGNNKIVVGFEKDSEGKNLLIKNGKPVPKEEFMSEWSVKRLKTLLYEGRIRLPMDYKLDTQLSSVVSITSGSRKIYACISETGDHLFDGFKVFAIAQWLKKDFNSTPTMTQQMGLGVSKIRKQIELDYERNKEIIFRIHNGISIECTKIEFDRFISSLLLDRAVFYTFRGDIVRAKFANFEFERLNREFFVKGDN